MRDDGGKEDGLGRGGMRKDKFGCTAEEEVAALSRPREGGVSLQEWREV